MLPPPRALDDPRGLRMSPTLTASKGSAPVESRYDGRGKEIHRSVHDVRNASCRDDAVLLAASTMNEVAKHDPDTLEALNKALNKAPTFGSR